MIKTYTRDSDDDFLLPKVDSEVVAKTSVKAIAEIAKRLELAKEKASSVDSPVTRR
jgi:hypothetical protein